MASSSLTCADSINLLDNLPAIADPVSVGEPRPSALAREALLTDCASAQVGHVRWTGSTLVRRPCAVPVLARGTGGTAARAETRCGRGHIASQRFCVVLSILGTSGAGLVAQHGSQRPAMAIPSSRHRLGPRDMSLEAKRSRHVAVAIPEIRISRVIAVRLRQKSPQPQQPNLSYRQTLFGWRGR
jgi:hypothetical protein